MQRWLVLFAFAASSMAWAEGPRVSLNATVGGRWLDEASIGDGHQRVSLSGAGPAFGGSLDVAWRLSRFRLGGQLAVEAIQSPESDLGVSRAGPLATSVETSDAVTNALFLSASPFAGLTIGDGPLRGWFDLLLSVEVLSAKVEGDRMFGLKPVPTLRLGFAVEVGAAALEVSVLGAFLGSPRVALAAGLQF